MAHPVQHRTQEPAPAADFVTSGPRLYGVPAATTADP